MKDLHLLYVKKKVKDSKFVESHDKTSASNFKNGAFDIKEAQNILLVRTDASYFLYKKAVLIRCPYLYMFDEKPQPDSEAIQAALASFNPITSFFTNPNQKGVKDFKPSKIDLSKIPSSSYDNEEVDEEYKPYLKQTTLSNPSSVLTKDVFLKHKRRRSNIAKPDKKAPEVVHSLFTKYQDILANINQNSVDRYCNMLKYKETISN